MFLVLVCGQSTLVVRENSQQRPKEAVDSNVTGPTGVRDFIRASTHRGDPMPQQTKMCKVLLGVKLFVKLFGTTQQTFW